MLLKNILPIADVTTKFVFATVQTNLTQSYCDVADKYPPVPIVVDAIPKNICCPAFCDILHKPVPVPTTSIIEPKSEVDGNVIVVNVVAVPTYPLLTAAVCDVVALFQVNPPIEDVDKV